MRGLGILSALAFLALAPAAAQETALDPALARWLAERPDVRAPVSSAIGLASYYSREIAGNRTASGEPCNPEDFTAAHRTMPFGSRVRVTNLASGLSTIVRINDRGPFRGNRVIDLSHAAARAIGLDRAGTGQVQLALLAD